MSEIKLIAHRQKSQQFYHDSHKNKYFILSVQPDIPDPNIQFKKVTRTIISKEVTRVGTPLGSYNRNVHGQLPAKKRKLVKRQQFKKNHFEYVAESSRNNQNDIQKATSSSYTKNSTIVRPSTSLGLSTIKHPEPKKIRPQTAAVRKNAIQNRVITEPDSPQLNFVKKLSYFDMKNEQNCIIKTEHRRELGQFIENDDEFRRSSATFVTVDQSPNATNATGFHRPRSSMTTQQRNRNSKLNFLDRVQKYKQCIMNIQPQEKGMVQVGTLFKNGSESIQQLKFQDEDDKKSQKRNDYSCQKSIGKPKILNTIAIDSTSDFHYKQPSKRSSISPKSSIFTKKRRSLMPFMNKGDLISETTRFSKVSVPSHLQLQARKQSLAQYNPSLEKLMKNEVLYVYGGKEGRDPRDSYESISSMASMASIAASQKSEKVVKEKVKKSKTKVNKEIEVSNSKIKFEDPIENYQLNFYKPGPEKPPPQWMKFGLKIKTKEMQEFELKKQQNEEICLLESINDKKEPKIQKTKTVGLFSEEVDLIDFDQCQKTDKQWLQKANPSVYEVLKKQAQKDTKKLLTKKQSAKLIDDMVKAKNKLYFKKK